MKLGQDDQARRVARAELVTRLFIVTLVVLLVAALATVVILVGQIRATQTRNSPVLHVIQDCTQPSGACYKRGQQQTAKVVGNIGTNTAVIVVCALEVPKGTPVPVAIRLVTACEHAHTP